MNSQLVKKKMMEALLKTLDEHAKMNLPFVYRDQSCKASNQFVYRYPDGKKVLIQQDRKTSAEKIIKVL